MANEIEFDLERLEYLASRGLTQEQIAHSFGASQATFSRRLNDDEEFEKAYKRGKAAGIETIANVLFNKAEQGDTTAGIFYLKCRAGWRDSQHIQVDATHKRVIVEKVATSVNRDD